nr:hypothetical protein [Tanacetum cinerariifolium]
MVDTAYPKSYCLLLDTVYWILFPSWSLVSACIDTPYLKIRHIGCQNKVKAMDASLGNADNSRIVSDKGNTKSLDNDCSKTGNDRSSKNHSSTSGHESNRSRKENSQSGNECSKRSKCWE